MISLAWDKALLSFCLNSYALLEVNCSGGGKSFELKTGEAGQIGRIPINGLVPATNYKLIVKWGAGKSVLEFKTLPKPSGKLQSSYVVLADPHVSEKKENRKGRLFIESGIILESIIDECNRQGLDFILIAGDLTNSSAKWEYDEVKKILKKSQCPVCVVPGDHDLAAGGIRRWRASFGSEQWIRDIKEYRIAGVNTGRNILDAKGRKLAEKATKSGLFPIILTHVPLLPNGKIKYGAKCRPITDYSEAPRGKPRGIFAEPCDLSGVALAKTEAKDAILSCHSSFGATEDPPCGKPQGFLAKKGEPEKYIREITSTPSIIYAGHQNIPTRVAVDRTVQINLPQPCQYICGYYMVKHFENGFYHMFMPIRSEILRQYSRRASELAVDFYHEKQWSSVYREGENIYESNFIIPG